MDIDFSVIVPCYNEQDNLSELVERLDKTFERGNLKGQIVLVDDGSADRTASVIRTLEVQNPRVKGVFHERNQGIAKAWTSGLEASSGYLVGVIDADLQYHPEDFLRLLRELRHSNADIAQGWRSSVGREKGPRYYWSRGLCWLLNCLFGMKLRDNKSGFFVCRRDVFKNIMNHRRRYHYPQTFIMVAAKTRRYSIIELETLFENRRIGKSFLPDFPLKVILRSFVDIFNAWLEFGFSVFKNDVLEQFLRESPVAASSEPVPLWRRIWFGLFLLSWRFHHWTVTNTAGHYLGLLRKSQWMPQERIRELQDRKLRALVEHAYRHVPYYREKMKELGVVPKDIQSAEDLHKLPMLTKADIRQNLYFDLMSDNHDKNEILRVTTSGSTGEPLVIFCDRYQLEYRWANTMRNMEWTGWRFGDKQVRLWHQTIGMKRSQIMREWLDAVFNRRTFFPAWEVTEKTIGEYIRILNREKPVLLDGYAESFNFIAHYLKSHEARLEAHPRGIISSAQTLSEQSRRIIESEFNTRVLDKYGSREFSGIAHECEEHQGYHVNAESYIVEILKEGRPAAPGEVGEVVITDLNNHCIPLIRYRLGDLAQVVEQTCPCGRGLPLIGNVQGRVQSIIVGTENQYVPGSFFAHLLKDYDHAIRQFQVVQEKLGEIDLKLIKGMRYSDEIMTDLLETLRRFLGRDMKINVEFVDKIPLGRTGKHYHSISRLDIDYQNASGPEM